MKINQAGNLFLSKVFRKSRAGTQPRAKNRAAAKGDEFSKTRKADPDISELLKQYREKEIPYAQNALALNRVDQVRAKYGLTGQGVGVLLADTGFNHPDYRPEAWIDLAGDSPQPEDLIGHGTQCAGSLLDMAPGIRMLSLRMHRSGFEPDINKVAQALNWAAEHKDQYGIRVISLSLSLGPEYEKFASHPYIVPLSDADETLEAARKAAKVGITLVAAAGNRGPQSCTVSRLAEIPGVVIVGAAQSEEEVSDYSSRGPAMFAQGGVDLLAPGDLVATLDNPDLRYHETFTTGRATSASTPQVAGVAALMYEADPELTNEQVKQILKDTARPIKGYGKDAQGSGLVDAEAAIDRVYQFKAGRVKRED